MNDRQLKSFVEVADVGSFSKAAKNLYISPQALVQQINLLEQQVGVLLFARDQRGVTLTQAGDAFYTGAKQILGAIDAAYEQARAIGNANASTLHIGIFSSSMMIDRVSQRFTQQYPGIRLTYTIIPDEQWLTELESVCTHRLDLFEHVEVPQIYEKGLCFTPLISCTSSCVLSSTHPLAQRTALIVPDLAGQTVGIHHLECIAGLREHLTRNAPGITLVEASHGARSAFHLCAEGGVFLIPTTHAANFIPLITRPLSLDLAWRFGLVTQPNPTASVAAYIHLAQSLYADQG